MGVDEECFMLDVERLKKNMREQRASDTDGFECPEYVGGEAAEVSREALAIGR